MMEASKGPDVARSLGPMVPHENAKTLWLQAAHLLPADGEQMKLHRRLLYRRKMKDRPLADLRAKLSGVVSVVECGHFDDGHAP